MKWRVTIRPNAEVDAHEAVAWYDSQRKGLGDELLEELFSAIRALREHPERHPIYYRGFLRLLTRRFPYKVFYRIERDCVVVFRILHAKRDHRRQL